MSCALDIISVSGKTPDWVENGCSEYAKRFPSNIAMRFIRVPAVKRTRSINTTEAVRQEGQRLRKALKDQNHCIAMDERGRGINSLKMADYMRQWLEDSQHVSFLIGGADGLPDDLLEQAADVWSLSSLTLPHALARLVLTEQLYRSWSLLQGHPYHRE